MTLDNTQICQILNIEKEVCREIYARLESELEAQNTLGERLNNIAAKQKLKPAFQKIKDQFPDVSANVSEVCFEQCLMKLAQNCNYNRNRRGITVRQVLNTKDSTVACDSGAKRRTDIPFGSTILFIERKTRTPLVRVKYSVTQCMPHDLVTGTGPDRSRISIEDVQYSKFVTVLKEDMGFDENQESIFYKPLNMDFFQVATQRAWRTALHEMFSAGYRRMAFMIDKAYFSSTNGQGDEEQGQGKGLVPASPTDAAHSIATCHARLGNKRKRKSSFDINEDQFPRKRG